VQRLIDSQAQHFMVCWFSTFFFKLLFFWIYWLFFHDTYNTQLKERYENDPLTHPNLNLDLWLEAGSYGGTNRNHMYGLSNH
jgi:3-deoxy-D-manno-octulosonic-acid transferase